MQKLTPIPGLAILVCIFACSKHHDKPLPPLTHTDSLMIGTSWALQKSDTLYYDAGNNIIDHKTYAPSGCSDQLHFAFYRDQIFQLYNGCSQPAFDPTPPKTTAGWTWFISTNGFLTFYFQSGDPRSPSWAYGYDSVITLTKDSLVVAADARQHDAVFPQGSFTNRKLLVTDVYTH